MSLDLFAVLFGGAVALLPIYARDILHVGPAGLGWMQAAPSFGAISMAMLMNHLPPLKQAGRTLLLAVAGFGAATIVFGLSRNFWLSLAMLFLTGAFDNISVVIRQTLATLLTPDEMRGRVSAVNGMFISMSNELGRVESGSVAALTTPVFSVISGGIGTLLVVSVIALLSPQLRKYGALDGDRK
jgi:MFS family permease